MGGLSAAAAAGRLGGGFTWAAAPADVLDVEKQQEKAEGRHRRCGAAEQELETALAVHHLQEQTTAFRRCTFELNVQRASRRREKVLTDPKTTCSSISPVLALVTRTVVAQPLTQRKTRNSPVWRKIQLHMCE